MESDSFKNKIDALSIFNPSEWPGREIIARGTALLFVTVFLYFKFVNFKQYPGIFHEWNWFWVLHFSTWAIETGILLGYILSYLTREKAVLVAKGFMETAFPIFIAGLPVLISFAPYTFDSFIQPRSPIYLPAYFTVAALMLMGNIINFSGLLSLRKAFTLMSEARALVTGGLFKYIRHPLYLGHFILFLGSTLFRFHWYTALIYVIFLSGQVYRAKVEEKKLEEAFDQYREYKLKTGMFLPKFSSRN